MPQSSVSVVIPAYNAEQFIRRAIDSVLAQTAQAAEVIVVDDGSQDGTCAAVESYGAAARLIRQENGGPSVARNTGVAAATSEYVALLDADDTWEGQKLELQLAAFAANPSAVLCYTGITTVAENGEERVHAVMAPERLGDVIRVQMPGIPPSCAMIRREAYLEAGGFKPALSGIEDWEFVLRLFRRGVFCAVDTPLLRYRISSSGVSSDADRIYREVLALVDPVLLEGLHGFRRWLWRRRILSFQSYKGGLTSRTTGSKQELRYMLRSLLIWPSPFWCAERYKATAVSLLNAVLRIREPGRSVVQQKRA